MTLALAYSSSDKENPASMLEAKHNQPQPEPPAWTCFNDQSQVNANIKDVEPKFSPDGDIKDGKEGKPGPLPEEVDEREVLAFCFPDSGKLSELNKAAARGRPGARDSAAKWLSELARNVDLTGFAGGIVRALSRSKPDPEAERLTSFPPATEAAFVEFAGYAMMMGEDFSGVKPETTAGKFLNAVKQKLAEKGVEDVFKRLGQATPATRGFVNSRFDALREELRKEIGLVDAKAGRALHEATKAHVRIDVLDTRVDGIEAKAEKERKEREEKEKEKDKEARRRSAEKTEATLKAIAQIKEQQEELARQQAQTWAQGGQHSVAIEAQGEQIKNISAEIEQIQAAREEAKTEAARATEQADKRYEAAIAAAEEERLAEVADIQQRLQAQCEEFHKALEEKAEKADLEEEVKAREDSYMELGVKTKWGLKELKKEGIARNDESRKRDATLAAKVGQTMKRVGNLEKEAAEKGECSTATATANAEAIKLNNKADAFFAEIGFDLD